MRGSREEVTESTCVAGRSPSHTIRFIIPPGGTSVPLALRRAVAAEARCPAERSGAKLIRRDSDAYRGAQSGRGRQPSQRISSGRTGFGRHIRTIYGMFAPERGRKLAGNGGGCPVSQARRVPLSFAALMWPDHRCCAFLSPCGVGLVSNDLTLETSCADFSFMRALG